MGHVTWFTFAILLICCKSIHQSEVNTSEYDDYEDDYYDDPPQIYDKQEKDISASSNSKYFNKGQHVTDAPKAIKNYKEETTTKTPIPTYEVTELFVDVPDTSTKKVPIFNNFTIIRPLNLAEIGGNQISTFNTVNKDEGDEVMNAIFVPDNSSVSTNKQNQNVKGRNSKADDRKERKFNTGISNSKDYFNKDINDNSDEDNSEDLDFKDEPKSFKDYFHGIKKDIVTGFKSVIEKDDNEGDLVHKVAHVPISILSKLHRKVTNIVHEFHKSVSKHEHNHRDFDYNDDCYY